MNVLAVGAHPDDIEIGCGGTLLAHRRHGDRVTMLVMTTGERGPQAARSRIAEQQDAAQMLDADLVWGGFDDGAVPDGRAAIDLIQDVVRQHDCDVVYSHGRNDTHQDHRATASATLAACRRAQRVLLYESPTSFGFTPSVFVDIDDVVEAKAELIRSHMSQVLKNGLVDLEAVEGQARYRGFQARLRRAEAFEVDRFVWDLARGRTVVVGAEHVLQLVGGAGPDVA